MSTVINPHLTFTAEKLPSDREVRRLNRQYEKRQRYVKKYGAGSMRSLRNVFRREKREDPSLTFKSWLRSLGNVPGTLSPKAARIRGN